MSSESLGRKLFVSAFEKLVLATLAAMLIFVFESNWKSHQEKMTRFELQQESLKERAVALARVRTDLLTKASHDLAVAVGNYVALVVQIDVRAEGKQRDALEDLRFRIVAALLGAMAVDASLQHEAEGFMDEVLKLNSDLLGFGRGPEALHQAIRHLMNGYVAFTRSMGAATVAAVRKDFEDAGSAMNRAVK